MPTRAAPARRTRSAPARPTAAAPAPAPTPAKPAPARKDAKPAKNAPVPPAAKIQKAPRKPKLVRDGFTMPEDDFALVGVLKQRAMSAGREAKKSELLRAGLHALARLEPKALVVALQRLQPVKTGRPKKGH